MQNSIITILPPLIVLVLAFLTHRILFSLLVGIICGTFIANDFSVTLAIKDAVFTIWNTTQLENITSISKIMQSESILLFTFLLALGSIITLMSYTGGVNAYRNFISKKIKTPVGAQNSSLILSFFFFLDDFFSCATVGSVMHPLTDKFNIARTKLAFLVNSMGPTLAVITPISSWSATIVLNINNAGISDIAKNKPLIFADPFYLYLGVIPFVFYSMIMIASVWFITTKKISFGLMKKHEKIAQQTGNLFGGKKEISIKQKSTNKTSKNMIDFLFPLFTLIFSIIILILYTGDYFLLFGSNSFIQAIQRGNPVQALFGGSLITLFIGLVYFLIKKTIKFKDITEILLDGIKLLGPSIFVLVLAWSFTDILNNQLLAGKYLANLFIEYVNIEFLPLLFYAITTLTAIAIASAWGAMAIMIPIAIEMLTTFTNGNSIIPVQAVPIIYPLLGAILSGGVTGNHTSPTSDTMLMSARSTRAYHMDHVRTQHTYSFPAIISTSLTFLLAGMLINKYSVQTVFIICLFSGILFNFGILSIRNRLSK